MHPGVDWLPRHLPADFLDVAVPPGITALPMLEGAAGIAPTMALLSGEAGAVSVRWKSRRETHPAELR